MRDWAIDVRDKPRLLKLPECDTLTAPLNSVISRRGMFDHNGREKRALCALAGAFGGESSPMNVGRRIWLLTALAVSLAGCRAAGTGSLSLLPRRNLSPNALDLDEFIAQHNQNAEAIDSLEAQPSINVAMGRVKVYKFSVDGRMALERPRNFKLELKDHNLPKADIGSNSDEFWYWVVNDDKDQKWIYWCDYRDVETSKLPVTYQPDWIIEALGLKPITREEAATIRVGQGTEGTSILTFAPVRDRGEPYVREMVVSNNDRRIKRLRILSESPRMLIAEAMPSDYQAYAAGASNDSARESSYLPQKLRLEWKREQLVLDVNLGQVKINEFDHSRAAEIFTEPDMPGYRRMNLAELTRGQRPERRTRTRQTMPPPDSPTGVELGRPVPAPDDEPTVPNLGQVKPQPAPETDDQPHPTLDDLVGAPVPRPPSSGPLQSASRLFGPPGRDSAVE
jgi:hypothetical protein